MKHSLKGGNACGHMITVGHEQHTATTVIHPSCKFLVHFIEWTSRSPSLGNGLYAAGLPARVCAGAVRGISASMAELSDSGRLKEMFLVLLCPKMFMIGEQNLGLSYLEQLKEEGVELAWRIAAFLGESP
ncbi:lipoyl ligase [Aspergillus pseudoviridinutans]|uniref:Lipoyl ligase n=1 Tax=Aspergillus pseudoviridinutans TaxID=1517512 RepID=A0A9P3BNB6_9EURO|nr:lipoyl ligase [Aspergillus pseudoviridinutans]GIJ90884.1 lipoyl ligase [Aspergillus pseudoviridinutans]